VKVIKFFVILNVMTASAITKGNRFFYLINTEGSRISKCHQNPSTIVYIISCIAAKLAVSTTPGTFSVWFTMIISNNVSYFPFSFKGTCFCEHDTVGNKPEQNRDV
jgi:hypothetical protein